MKQSKKYLVVGMGKSGIAAARALLSLGNTVAVYDKKTREEVEPQLLNYFQAQKVTCYYGQEPEKIERFDCLIVSPGVPLTLSFIQEAMAKNVEVISELELAYRIGRGTYIAITGTNGKTTTTTLCGEIFKDAKRKTKVVGNIGVAAIGAAFGCEPDTWLVTECSSFQLETTYTFHPKVSALLNISPDHLDRHKTLENYMKAKAMIFQNQTEEDYFVVNADDERAYSLAKDCKAKVIPFSRKKELPLGAFVREDSLVIKNEAGELLDLCGVKELLIPGTHNLENALAAAAISYFSGVEATVVATALREFQGVEHRLEFFSEISSVRFVNDSKGTNPEASIKAIEAVSGRIILIAGGYDKKAGYDRFVEAFDGKVAHLILMGQTAPEIKATAERLGFSNIHMAKDMGECVRLAFELAKPGDTVLLSPACASWDMYDNFEQRGRHFKTCVQELER